MLRDLILAAISAVAPILYSLIAGWDPSFPVDQASFVNVLVWIVGWILTLIGYPASGALLYRHAKSKELTLKGLTNIDNILVIPHNKRAEKK